MAVCELSTASPRATGSWTGEKVRRRVARTVGNRPEKPSRLFRPPRARRTRWTRTPEAGPTNSSRINPSVTFRHPTNKKIQTHTDSTP